MLDFHESWSLALEFPRDVTEFYRIQKLKGRKNDESVWYDQCLKLTETTFFKGRFPKLDFLIAMSITKVAKSEKWK